MKNKGDEQSNYSGLEYKLIKIKNKEMMRKKDDI